MLPLPDEPVESLAADTDETVSVPPVASTDVLVILFDAAFDTDDMLLGEAESMETELLIGALLVDGLDVQLDDPLGIFDVSVLDTKSTEVVYSALVDEASLVNPLVDNGVDAPLDSLVAPIDVAGAAVTLTDALVDK